MKKVLKLISKKEWLLFIYSGIFIIFQVVLEVAIPKKMSTITELLQNEGGNTLQILVQGALMFLYALLAFGAAVLVSLFIAKAGAAFDKCVREKVFEKTLDFSLAEMGEFGTSSMISRCTSDITQIQRFVTSGIQVLIKSPITVIWVIISILGTHIYWVMAMIVAVGIISVALTVMTVIAMPYVRVFQQKNDRLLEVAREHISGIRVVHAYNAHKYQKRKFEKINEEQIKTLLTYDRIMAAFSPGGNAVLYALSIVIYVLGAYIIMEAADAARVKLYSDMVTFVSYAAMLMNAFICLIMVVSILPNTLVSVRRIAEVLDKPLSIKDGAGVSGEVNKETGVIEFNNVTFRYPGTKGDVLKNISFRVKKGETVAVIGATGSGKTTLINLIPRFYDVSQGSVLVEGKDVRDYKVKELRNIIGYVPQKSYLFSGTIADNIAYGDNGRFQATLTDIVEAAKVGQADEFIQLKENGYYSAVAQGGANFSGGQRQRLTISRAICRNPEIFIFDDSFSALDYKTDSALRKKLRESAGDATLLIVAQRISTIRNADRIIVIDKGCIVGEGTHNELMKNCGVYQEIAKSQSVEEVAG